MTRIFAAKRACAVASIGRCLILVLAGKAPRWSPPFQSLTGRTGRGAKPPPQFGQTSPSRVTQSVQNVHSKEQIRAFDESGGSATAQFSQVGLSSSIGCPSNDQAHLPAGLSEL
jgi:hypothetical protein